MYASTLMFRDVFVPLRANIYLWYNWIWNNQTMPSRHPLHSHTNTNKLHSYAYLQHARTNTPHMLPDLRFSQRCCYVYRSSGTWRRVVGYGSIEHHNINTHATWILNYYLLTTDSPLPFFTITIFASYITQPLKPEYSRFFPPEVNTKIHWTDHAHT